MLFKHILLLHQDKNNSDSFQNNITLLRIFQAILPDVLIKSQRHLEFLGVDPLLKGKPGPVVDIKLVVSAF